jgi:hypothetical protein
LSFPPRSEIRTSTRRGVGIFFGGGDPIHGVGAECISKGFVREHK